jgi:8-oxo-dGTP pyrophosphatase MutT (NUDIX family)
MRGTTNVPSVYIILRRDEKTAFLLRTNTDFMNGKYCLPSGHAEGLESFKQAAVREAEEEAGVIVTPAQLHHIHTMHRYCGDHIRVDVFFEAADWQGEPVNNEPESHGELAWFEAANLPFDKIVDWQGAALKSIQRGETYSEFDWPAAS